MPTPTTVRERVAAASRRIARLKRFDRAATGVIVLGGIAVVASVLGILVFILAEAWPLFRPARAKLVAEIPSSATSTAPPAAPLAFGVDEYQRYYYQILNDGRIVLRRLVDGGFARAFPVAALAGRSVAVASRSPEGHFAALATADGHVALVELRFTPRYQAQRLVDLDSEVRERGLIAIDPAGRPVRAVSYREHDGAQVVAAIVADDEIRLWRAGGDGGEQADTLRGRPGERFTRLSLGRQDALIAGTDKGNVLHWELQPEPRLTDVSPVGSSPITALEWILGSTSWVAGNAQGEVTGWFRSRLHEDDDQRPMVRAHVFPAQQSAILVIAPSARDRSFLTLGSDGSLAYRFFTNERTLATLPGSGSEALSALITPKNDGILLQRRNGSLARYAVDSPHPEVTWAALFGRLWYEGYPGATYVWQSTGATNDFEAKLSLVPLIFGTIKGTLYALLVAIPLGVLGALYTSQFVHPRVKAKIKPTVEIMAALPSVVVGFIAGLWLAPLVERHVVAVALMAVLMPGAGTSGVLLWGALPRAAMRRLRAGTEVLLILPLLLLGGWLATVLAPAVETALFAGDFRLWLANTLGLTYDQRNCLVIGIAMGFAVIPIIFTISEDAFSSVPSNLSAASLALGASRWQTAVRVVLPTASPGVFSAVMIGFGRAVGETMIVLMATGNTPVLDWSIFNGMRTLAANIAVEVPEAPHGGTLYRVLFLAGGVLFAMTFAVNTVAELIRQRLRQRYRAL
jgi:phosphate transport system permease protein